MRLSAFRDLPQILKKHESLANLVSEQLLESLPR